MPVKNKVDFFLKHSFVFLLAIMLLFSAGCKSGRIPCPKMNKSAKKGIKDSKIKGVADQAKTAASIGGISNEYDNKGHIKKSKFKHLRNRPDRKVTKKDKKSILSIFSKE